MRERERTRPFFLANKVRIIYVEDHSLEKDTFNRKKENYEQKMRERKKVRKKELVWPAYKANDLCVKELVS